MLCSPSLSLTMPTVSTLAHGFLIACHRAVNALLDTFCYDGHPTGRNMMGEIISDTRNRVAFDPNIYVVFKDRKYKCQEGRLQEKGGVAAVHV